MRSVQIYIEGNKLDLFKDEEIQVNSTIQNISDISKVFNDFSQSFTVSATENNNKIFHHFYNSEVHKYNDIIFDVNVKKTASIEINLTEFRRGKIQLESANLKNGKVDSYTITFYGEVTSLKDKFGDEKLSDLDLTSMSHTWNGTEVYNRITDHTTDYDVRYPLISSFRNWNYGGGDSNDITALSGQIFYNELNPALKIKKIFEAIENKYGVTFNGNFLSDKRFTDCFLYMKNKNGIPEFKTEAQDINFIQVNYPSGTPNYSSANATSNSISYQYYNLISMAGAVFKIDITVTPSDNAVPYYIDVYRNGVYSHTATNTGQALTNVISDANVVGLNEEITLRYRADNQIDLVSNINAYWLSTPASVQSLEDISIACSIQTLSSNAPLSSWCTEMNVTDFFSGILSAFNLTCYGTETNVFQIEPLDEWYKLGAIHDITRYTDIESIDVKRVPLYSSISFSYLESESIINKGFKSLFFREYGSESYKFPYDGGEFKIELPFENIMQERFTGTDTQVGYCLNENLEPYTPKPSLMYMYDNQTTALKFYDGASTLDITNYIPFGQETRLNNSTDYSLNFSADNSTFNLVPNFNNLYSVYYNSYLKSLYNINNRLITVKTKLPISLLTTLELNDRLVIRDKRYIINEMKTNLNSGEVTFTLILDFRAVRPIQLIPTNPNANCVDVAITLPNGVCSIDLSTTTPGVTITPSTVTSSQIVSVCVPANANTKDYIITETTLDNLNSSLFERIITEESADQTITIDIQENYCNGAVNDTQIIIQQP